MHDDYFVKYIYYMSRIPVNVLYYSCSLRSIYFTLWRSVPPVCVAPGAEKRQCYV